METVCEGGLGLTLVSVAVPCTAAILTPLYASRPTESCDYRLEQPAGRRPDARCDGRVRNHASGCLLRGGWERRLQSQKLARR